MQANSQDALALALPAFKKALADVNQAGLRELSLPGGRYVSILDLRDALDAHIDALNAPNAEIDDKTAAIAAAIVLEVRKNCFRGAFGLCSKEQAASMADEAATTVDPTRSPEVLQAAVAELWVD